MPLTSFFTALTGLNNNALTINVVGNNLANINTVAFKASRTSFAEMLGGLSGATASSGSPIQVGLGAITAGVSPLFNQGSIQSTGREIDTAISGNGFFVLANGTDLGYTRAGNFSFSGVGQLVSGDGLPVLGYRAANGVIDTNSALVPITILKGSILVPKATTSLAINANLDSRLAVDATYSVGVQIYDSLGNPHTVTLTFTKTGVTEWHWEATVPAVDTGGDSGDPPTSLGEGDLVFDENGVLTSPTENATLTLNGLATGAADMEISFEILDAAGLSSIASYASASNLSSSIQDGYGAGVLRDISIDSAGIVSGMFDNGQVQPLAQLALASFPNPEGLLKLRGCTLVARGASGEPSIGSPGTGSRGLITGAALEQSNVDMAQEFTNMIIAQRGYQANSRVIVTTDELYQDAINLKR